MVRRVALYYIYLFLDVIFAGPMSMLAHIVHHTLKDPKLVTLDGYLKWWFGCIAPIVSSETSE